MFQHRRIQTMPMFNTNLMYFCTPAQFIKCIPLFLFLLGIKVVFSFNRHNFGKFQQDLPLVHLFEGLKRGIFALKGKMFGLWYLMDKKRITGPKTSFYFFLLNINP